MNTYKSCLAAAYKEWRGIFDDSFTKEYNAGSVRFKICSDNDGLPLVCFIRDGIDGFFSVSNIPDKMYVKMFCEYEKDYPYQLIIDNTDKDSTYLRYLDERFTTLDELKNKLLKIVTEAEKKIGMIGFYYLDKSCFFVHFTENNKIERITTLLCINPNTIFDDVSPEVFEWDYFVCDSEILTNSKKHFLMRDK